jgi:hypothetical protein
MEYLSSRTRLWQVLFALARKSWLRVLYDSAASAETVSFEVEITRLPFST